MTSRSPDAPASDREVGSGVGVPGAQGEGQDVLIAEQPLGRRGVAWYWRLVAWTFAVPVGFVVTMLPAYWWGIIRRSDVLDVFVGSGVGRYGRLAAVTVVWAFVMTVLVTLVVAVVSRHARGDATIDPEEPTWSDERVQHAKRTSS